jgi:hypothetical protein
MQLYSLYKNFAGQIQRKQQEFVQETNFAGQIWLREAKFDQNNDFAGEISKIS